MNRSASVLSLVLVAVLSAPAALAAPRGPAFGANRYSTTIQSGGGGADTDDYVAPLIQGESLTVTVSAARRSALRPTFELVAPDGEVLAPTLRKRRRGRSAGLRAFVIDQTGEWTVRVAGDAGTEGAYTVTFRVGRAPPVRARRLSLGGADGLTRTHGIEAVDGALLDLTVTWRPRSAAVEVRALDDPRGDPVPGAGGDAVDDVTTVRRRARLRRAPLSTGHGAYSLDLGIDAGTASYDLLARVTPQNRPRGRRTVRLSGDEPHIASGGVIRGIAGRPVQIQGVNFSTAEAPTVFFGDEPGADVVVAPGGVRVTVTPPPGVEGSTVELSVVNPDGQASTRADAFYYAPPPVVTALVDADGDPVIGGSSDGGQIVRVLGTGLFADHTVLFGSLPGSVVLTSGTTELRVSTPTSPAGVVQVSVVDEFGRSGVAPTTFIFKQPPLFAANAYSPPLGRPNEAVVVTISGDNFEAADELLFDGAAVPFTFVSANTLTLSLDAMPAGAHTIALRDSIGTVVSGPDFVFKDAATIDTVLGVAGAYAPPADVPLLGGATIEVVGTGFHPTDTVTLDAVPLAVTNRTATAFRFVVPAGAPGPRTLRIVDGIGQSVTLADAVRYVGFQDATATRSPGKSATDDLTALRGAIGDLDRDGEDDDLVLVSYDYYRGNDYRGLRTGGSGTYNSPGTRAEYTRIFFGDSVGRLVDRTATNFPAATTGTYPDNWNAMAVAIGDLDGANGADVVIGGVVPYPGYQLYNDVRIFTNDGSGQFALETANPLPSSFAGPLYAYDENNTQHVIFTPRYVAGMPTSIAIGDVDGDLTLDVVVGRDFYDSTYVYLDPSPPPAGTSRIDFTQSPPYVNSAYTGPNYQLNLIYYYSATQVFLNQAAGWVESTDTSMPFTADSALAPVPAFHAEDLALGDLDGDDDLDLVLTGPDPGRVTPTGLYAGSGTARVATRVLTNDGGGVFTDVTATWLPAGAGNEFWQAHRMALADLDGDDDLDLLLLLRDSIDAYLATPTYGQYALRVLRNDGSSFTDVTTTVLPPLPTDSNDNLRGDALRVADVNGDGHLDVLVGTRQTITATSGARLRSTRLLIGTAAFRFVLASDFLPRATADTGEAEDLLVGDLEGVSGPVLLLLTEQAPRTSPGAENLRALDWKR